MRVDKLEEDKQGLVCDIRMNCKMKEKLYKTFAISNAVWCRDVANYEGPRTKNRGGGDEDAKVDERHDKVRQD